ncbi:MAG: hypothetical protein ACI845_001232 [Gammaproteobacteria bacterium]
MPSKSIRKFIRHPADIPIQVVVDWVDDGEDDSADQTLTNVSLGGLSFLSEKPIGILKRVKVSVPVLNHENFIIGTVVWCNPSERIYEIGLEFDSAQDMFRLRMIEQICHIEHYRREIERVEHRHLTSQQAAKEWISRYAGDFPAL